MQSPEMMIKWRRELGPLLLLPEEYDQMSKRCGLEHHVLLLLANHDYSSVMESTPTKLPFIGLCLAGLNLGRPSLHPQTLVRGLGPSGGITLDQTGALLVLLHETGQNWTDHRLGKFGKVI